MPLLFLALAAAAACDHSSSVGAAPTEVSAQAGSSVVLTAEPVALRSEVVSNPSCLPAAAYGTRLVLGVSGRPGMSVVGLHFRFTTTRGTIYPVIIPMSGLSPMSVPTNAVPIPGQGMSTMAGLFPLPVSAPQRLPFLVTFGCGSSTEGVLVVTADVSTQTGMTGTSELQLRVTR